MIYRLSFNNLAPKSKFNDKRRSIVLKAWEEFLDLSHERTKDARRLREANLLEYGYDVKEKISRLKQTI